MGAKSCHRIAQRLLLIDINRLELGWLQAATQRPNKRGWPLNVAVVDSGGNLVTFARMDGAQLASIAISEQQGTCRSQISSANQSD